jgi:hypothetical protein
MKSDHLVIVLSWVTVSVLIIVMVVCLTAIGYLLGV